MTEKVYEFNELDPNFWSVWTGYGRRNIFEISEGKFKFDVAFRRSIHQGYVVLRTSRPYSFINNQFSIDFEVTPDSFGAISLMFSPEKAEGGCATFGLKNADVLSFELLETWCQMLSYRIRNGGIQFYHVKVFEELKYSGTLKLINSQGTVAFLIDNNTVMSIPEEFKYGYIYIQILPELTSRGEFRRLAGSLDNFRIADYETACLNPELATLIPNLNQFTRSTLMLVTVLGLVGALRGIVGKI
ncbi:MAG: hypothetical protein QXZ68_05010 [Candidatus Bathyarchaeia archaeon]